MKLLFSSPLSPEVGLLKSLLDEAGIASEIRNDSVHPLFPGAPFQPEVWVLNEADYAEACRLRDAWRESVSAEVSQQDSGGNKRPTCANFLACGVGALIFLGLAVLTRKRFADTGDMRSAVGCAFMLLATGLFVWLAVAQWRVWSRMK